MLIATLPRSWRGTFRTELAGRLVRYSALQVVVQLAVFAAGIIVIRGLTKREYAIFAMATAIQTTFSILTDSGMSIAMTSAGGEVWDDRRRLGQLISAGLQWRRRMGAACAVVIAPLLVILLHRQETSYAEIAIVVVAVLASVSIQLHTHVLATALRLRSQVNTLQVAELVATCVRIVCIVTLFLVWRTAAVAVVGASVGVVAQALLVARRSSREIDRSLPVLADDTRRIGAIVRTQLANTVFYCVQGQIALWLIAIFGNSDRIAEVAGLGRLAIVMAVMASMVTNLAVPAFARCRDRTRLRQLYAQVVGAYLAMAAGLTIVCAALPRQILLVLGDNYRHLQYELVIIAATTGLGALVDAMWTLNTARAWVRHSWMNIPLLLCTQVVLILVLDLRTVAGVLWFGLWSTVPQLLINGWLTARGFSGTSALQVSSP